MEERKRGHCGELLDEHLTFKQLVGILTIKAHLTKILKEDIEGMSPSAVQ